MCRDDANTAWGMENKLVLRSILVRPKKSKKKRYKGSKACLNIYENYKYMLCVEAVHCSSHRVIIVIVKQLEDMHDHRELGSPSLE